LAIVRALTDRIMVFPRTKFVAAPVLQPSAKPLSEQSRQTDYVAASIWFP
jgi:hypothetical protein